MASTLREQLEQREREILASQAALSAATRGRLRAARSASICLAKVNIK